MAELKTSIKDVNSITTALTGDSSTFIRYHSDAEAKMWLTEGSAVDLDASLIKNGSEVGYGLSHVFTNIESNKFHFLCVENDGYPYTEDVTVSMVDYVKLTCNMSSTTIDGEGNVEIRCTGNCFNGSFGKKVNFIDAKCRYKVVGESSFSGWKTMNVTLNSKTYSAKLSLADLEYHNDYVFEVMVFDELEEIRTQRMITSKPIFHWGKNDFTFEVPVVFKTNEVRLQKSDTPSEGSSLKFGNGDYCYITRKDDNSLYMWAFQDINLKTGEGNVKVNGSPITSSESGKWTPYFSTGISSYTTSKGWYSKVGQTVTVGFYIKAVCDSGYQDYAIQIGDLPYIPLYPASGGGMCSGAYVAGGDNFQCFVAETSGIITTRVQACNNTSASNLSTSASGCFYRKGGGEITLSGTITYLTNE